jgi:hypothetical protein
MNHRLNLDIQQYRLVTTRCIGRNGFGAGILDYNDIDHLKNK